MLIRDRRVAVCLSVVFDTVSFAHIYRLRVGEDKRKIVLQMRRITCARVLRIP